MSFVWEDGAPCVVCSTLFALREGGGGDVWVPAVVLGSGRGLGLWFVVVVGDFEKWSVERGIDVVECGSVVDSVERFREPFANETRLKGK